MSPCWCSSASNARRLEQEGAVELKIKTTVNSTEQWLARCREKKAFNDRQRAANALRRRKLEADRQEILLQKTRAEQELQRLKEDLAAIDEFFVKLEEAEADIARLDAEIAREEAEIHNREVSIKDHLGAIDSITNTLPFTPTRPESSQWSGAATIPLKDNQSLAPSPLGSGYNTTPAGSTGISPANTSPLAMPPSPSSIQA